MQLLYLHKSTCFILKSIKIIQLSTSQVFSQTVARICYKLKKYLL